jgi:hypothetical protein
MAGEERREFSRRAQLDPQAGDGAKGHPDAMEASRHCNDLEATSGSSHGGHAIPDRAA